MGHRVAALPRVVSLAACLALAGVGVGAAERVSLDEGWRFSRGDLPGAEAPDYRDSDWRLLDVPHDWAIEGPFDTKCSPHCGGLPFYGIAWYRKRFAVPESAKGRYYSVEFDGAMSNARVWLNGEELGGRPYGYIGFAFDLTPHLRFGGENLLAVRLAPEDQSSRWYPGAGLYRNVWVDSMASVHVARWGTYVTTPKVTDAEAAASIRTDVRNRRGEAATVTLETDVLDAAGKSVAHASSPVTVPAGATVAVASSLVVARPERWDVDRPYLYTAVSVVKSADGVLDRQVTPFGFRTIEFDKVKGFVLNGRPLKMHGVCMHHDLGALGTAVSRRAIERQLQILKGMGVNALRTSHNPPAPEMLEYCDKLGLVVMDEAFDMWRRPKVPNGHGKYFDEWGETDLRDMIRRDRNHPSVVLWSIGNEVLEQDEPQGAVIAKRLAAICHEVDPTRPVTAGLNQAENAIKNGLAAELDIPGFNYQPMGYEKILREHPGWIIVGAETASTVSSRGVYHLPLEKYVKHPSFRISGYDIITAPWAYPPDVEFDVQDRFPGILGEFVWTGFDYIGEPTPYWDWRDKTINDWPARSSYFGIVDLAGFPKDRYYLYQSVWTKEPMVHVLPHWNWEGREGQDIPVMVYTNAAAVELFLNGRSLGRKARFSEPVVLPVGKRIFESQSFSSKYRLLWKVPYASGALRAVAYDAAGKAVATDERRTAGPPARISLAPDRDRIAADGRDLSYVTVRIEDEDGNLCPLAENEVRFQVEGAGRRVAVDNGDAATFAPFQADQRKGFAGLALLIVGSKAGEAGPIHIEATSEGLQAAEATVTAVASGAAH
jgi:beta-galactosidase